MRAFIAVELPDSLKAELAELESCLKAGASGGVKWVVAEDIHITLKFLGDISPESTPDILAAIEAAADGIAPFRLGVGGLGVFPNLTSPQVVWVGVRGDTESLVALQGCLDKRLEALDFPLERRRFSPHLTLARMRRQATPDQRQIIGRLATETTFQAHSRIDVGSVSLMRSELTREGAIHTRIGSVAL